LREDVINLKTLRTLAGKQCRSSNAEINPNA